MNKNKSLIILFMCTITLFALSGSSSFSINSSSVDTLAITRINEIRSTSNTDVSKIKGKIYYVSLNGSDSNDGLSIDRPFKTLNKINTLMSNAVIKPGDAILLNDGDIFRGNISIKTHNITIGSYGDIKKGKPKLYGSPYNLKNTGSWKEVAPNIWKYQLLSGDAIITQDIGGLWFFCNKDNNNCTRTSTDGKTKYNFGDKKIPYKDFEETEENIYSILNKDLDFYHSGHATAKEETGKNLYVYSVGNPSDRFDEIEYASGTNGISFSTYTDVVIDNLEIKFYGHHGIGGGTVANLKVTNCEIGFIGGMKQYYNDDGRPTRFGNGVEIYGEVKDKTNYPVKEGFVLNNNYVYEVYDAALTFQYTANEKNKSKVERAVFNNNVIENCAYAIEYWNETKETNDTSITNDTYINKMYITNNILRKAGFGYTETRPRHTEAFIKAWDTGSDTKNVVKYDGEYIIENNIFDTSNINLNPDDTSYVGPVMLHISASNDKSLPIIRNNKFYNYNNRLFGYIYSKDTQKILFDYNKQLSFNEGILSDNEFIVYDDTTSNPTNVITGLTGNASYNINLAKRTLTITGSGDMADYASAKDTPWNQYKDYITNIVIDENVTYVGTSAFANLYYVQEIHLNAKNLKSLKPNNMTFYMVGKKSTGLTLYIGSKVTKIPYNFTNPSNLLSGSPYVTSIKFEGNSLTTIDSYALAYTYIDAINIPDSVEIINNGAFLSNPRLKVIVFPSKVTKLSENVLKNCKSLESVILGSSISTAESGSLEELPNLNRLVIPNESFVFPTDVTIINKVSPVGFQLFGPPSFEAIINNMKEILGASNLFYIPLDTYRPFIQGDGKNFLAIYPELHYGESTTYEIKPLSNSETIINGAKYRFIDKYKREYLIDGVNINIQTNSLSNIKMDVKLLGNNTKKDSNTIETQNIIFLGNSFLRGFGSQGMAATDKEYDYYYYVNQYLYSLNSNIKSVRTTINRWEEQPDSSIRKEKVQELIEEFNSMIDPNLPTKTVFIQLSENIGSNEERRKTFKDDFDYLLKEFKKAYPDAKIYVLYNTNVYKQTCDEIEEVSKNNELETIKYNVSQKRDRSFIGAKYYNWSKATSYVTETGVAWHPGDYGFVKMSSEIIDYLKSNITNKVSQVTSNKYTIDSENIIVSNIKTLLRNEFMNNITATDQIKIISDGLEVTNNVAIGTGTIIKVGATEYTLILKGDVTGDGNINLSDISKIYNYYKGKTTLNDNFIKAAKVNDSDSLSLSDISKLYNYYKDKINSL